MATYLFNGRPMTAERAGWRDMLLSFEDGTTELVPRDVFLDRAVVTGRDVLWMWAPNPGAGRYDR